MAQRPSQESRPIDAQSLSLLLDIELACAFILRYCSVPPLQGLRPGFQLHGELDEILQRIAVALAKLTRTADRARILLSRGEQHAIKLLAEGGSRATAREAARRTLLAAVPRLMLEAQALLSENREPWHADKLESGRLTTSMSLRIAGHRTNAT